MKRILLLVSMTILISACAQQPAPAATNPPAATGVVVTEAATEAVLPDAPAGTETATIPTATEGAPSAKLPAASFEAQTYINEAAGFALDYPAGWTVNETVIGDRGTQVQFLSSPDVANATTLPAGASRVTAAINQWDPKNDLAAYVANQKTAWEASGFSVLEEQQLTLEQGLPAVQLTVQTPEAQVVYLIAALRDQYLVLSGEGDLALAKEIVQRVRPISP